MEYIADVAISVLLLVMLGASLNLLLGYAGQVSMAQAAFFGIGAYTAGLLTLPVTEEARGLAARGVTSGLGWSQLPALLLAIGVSFLFALIVAIPAVRRVKGEYLILLTLAFQVIVNQLMNSLTGLTGGPYGLTPIPPIKLLGATLSSPVAAFWVFGAITSLVVAGCWALGESPFGRLLKGIREDEIVVQSLGKDTVAPKVLIFGVTAGVAGMAGALDAFYHQFIAPGTYNLDLSILVVAIVVLGGAGNLIGTVIAAAILGSLRPVLQSFAALTDIYSTAWQSVIYGAGLLAMMLVRPQGILPEGQGIGTLIRGVTSRRHPAVEQPLESDQAARVRPMVRAVAAVKGADPGDPWDQPADVVRVQGLSKVFDGIKAVDEVDMVLRDKTVTALIGPNGAGKTTLFNVMTGHLKPDHGTVLLHGRDITGQPPFRITKLGMARSFQDVRVLQRLSVLENVALAVPDQLGENVLMLALRPGGCRSAEVGTLEKARSCIEFVGMSGKLDRVVGTLSFAEQKMVAIARLLATDCDVLLLDEPTSGIDPSAVDNIIDQILRLRDLGKTVCVVEHSLHVVERLADHVYFLDQGHVVAQGTLGDLTSQEQLVAVYFGT